MMCAHLLKLPLLAIAVPFLMTWAILGVGVMIITGAAMLLRGACRGHRSGQASHVSAEKKCASRCSPPRLVPVMLVAIFGGVLITRSVRQSFDISSESQTAATEPSTDEAGRLLAEITGEGRETTGLIPVTVPRQTDNNLAATEPETGAAALGATDEPLAETIDENTPETFPVVVFQKTEPNGQSVETLPEWASEEPVDAFAVTGLSGVIRTGQHATPEDAEKEALLQLRLGLASTFAVTQPAAADWLPSEQVVLEAGVVTRRAIERRDVTVGEFTEPIFRAYWEITRPEDLESRLFAAWRPEALKSRLLLVGGGIGLLTLLFGSLAGYLRIDDATRGKYRKQIGWGTAALWVVAGLAVARIAAGLALAIVA